MANDYFTRSASFAPRTKAKSEDVKSELDAVSAGFDLLPIPLNDGTGFSSPLVVGEAVEQEHAVRLSQITSAESSIGANTQIVLDAKAATLAAKDSVDLSETATAGYASQAGGYATDAENSKDDAAQSKADIIAIVDQAETDIANTITQGKSDMSDISDIVDADAAAAAGSASSANNSALDSANSATASANSATESSGFADDSEASAVRSSQAAASAGEGFTGTSTTSLTIEKAEKTLTIETGKFFVLGQYVLIADDTAPELNQIKGTITSYDRVTGELIVNADSILGSGTFSAWAISIASSGGSGVSKAEQFDYSAGGTIPDAFVVALNPSAGNLLAALDDGQEGYVKKLINISGYNTSIVTGSGFIDLAPNEVANVISVGGRWYYTSSDSLGIAKSRFGVADVFNTGVTTYTSATALSDTQFVVSYTDNGNSGYGTSVVGTVSGGSITFGTEFVFNTGDTTYLSATALSDTQFVVSYTDNANDSYGTSIVGTVSGNSITFGSEIVFNTGVTTYLSATALSDTQFVVNYQDNGNSSYGTSTVGSLFA